MSSGMRVPLLLAAIAAVALAGCSDGPPTAELTPAAAPLSIEGSEAMVAFRAEVDPINDAAPNPVLPKDVSCSGNQLPPNVPADQFRCVDPRSDLNVTLRSVAADANGFTLVALKAGGQEEPLGALEPAEAVADASGLLTYHFNLTKPEDLTAAYTGLEVRLDGFPYASAAWAAGAQPFALNETLKGVSATGTAKGKDLTVNISGLPADGVFNGFLYQADPLSGGLIQVHKFPGVTNGEQVLTAPEDISDYAEFHIHLGDSKVNVFKATIG